MMKTREWLIYNAVLSWLANYESMEADLVPQYEELANNLKFEYEGFDDE